MLQLLEHCPNLILSKVRFAWTLKNLSLSIGIYKDEPFKLGSFGKLEPGYWNYFQLKRAVDTRQWGENYKSGAGIIYIYIIR